MQVVVVVDKEDAADVAFWQEHNPSVLEMAAGAKVQLFTLWGRKKKMPGSSQTEAFTMVKTGVPSVCVVTGGGQASKQRLSVQGDEATAFICQNFACRAPTTDPDKVKALLSEPGTSGMQPSKASIRLEPVDLGSLKNT